MKKGLIASLAVLFTLILTGMSFASVNPSLLPLAPNTDYTVTISKLTSAGLPLDLETTTSTTDSDGKLAFTLGHVPTKDEANFIFLTVRDGSGNIVRQGMAPAPPSNDNNATGLNYLSSTQVKTLLKAAAATHSDDPIVAAYLLIILRSPVVTPPDIDNLALLAGDALTDPDHGFEGYLLGHGVSADTLANFKKCLIYNPDNDAKTLRDFTRNFFQAVDATTDNAAASSMQKAGGFMASIFLDAGVCAGIGGGKILAAHNAAGDGAEIGGHMAQLTTNLKASIDTAMSAFHTKISIIRISTQYSAALSSLGATGNQVNQYLAAVHGLQQASSQVDQQFAGYFMDHDGYLAAHDNTTDDGVRAAMNDRYSAAWSQFQENIAADNATILAMRNALLDIYPGLQLPPDFGGYFDQNMQRRNWPIPQVVLTNWLAGSSFAYSPRDNTAIPAMMAQWMGSCSNPSFWDNNSCIGNSATWTPGRHAYSNFSGSTVFDGFFAIQEDLNIIQMKRSELWNDVAHPTNAQELANEEAFMQRVGNVRNHISGSKPASGGAVITDAQKEAIVQLLLPPQF